MPGIFDYLKWRGDIPVSAVPLGEADRLILSELVYIDFMSEEPIQLHEYCENALRKLEVLRESGVKANMLHHRQDERLLCELAKASRYAELKIGHSEAKFNKSIEEQFAAMTVLLPDNSIAVVYRGTDWSLVGWKEDFNMAYRDALPAQVSAVEYLNRIGRLYDGNISVFGHSKGGNLAVYSSAFCEKAVQSRITDITSFDGPGFSEKVITSDGYKSVADRVTTFMPRASIVAAFFSNNGKFTVVESRAAGLLQHIAYNWEIMAGGFVTAKRDVATQHISGALNEWILSLTEEERRRFIDTLWSVIARADVNELGDLFDGKNTIAIIKNYNSLDEASRKMLSDTLSKLNGVAKNSLRALVAESGKK